MLLAAFASTQGVLAKPASAGRTATSRARSWEGTAAQHACVLCGCALPGTLTRTPQHATSIPVYPRGSPAKNAFLSKPAA